MSITSSPFSPSNITSTFAVISSPVAASVNNTAEEVLIGSNPTTTLKSSTALLKPLKSQLATPNPVSSISSTPNFCFIGFIIVLFMFLKIFGFNNIY